jgi:hypothetical protein
LYCKITKFTTQRRSKHIERKGFIQSIVADPEPDPQYPYVFGPLDPDPDLLVQGTDPDPSTKQKKVEKFLVLLLCNFFMTFYL